MSSLAGRTLSHYRLDAKIGAGGMGEVYRGLDTRLNRPVAVKILPSELLQDEERRRRFTQEARAASALNHPNIVTIYDVGSEAGVDLIVMEHVNGKTLDEHIGRRPMAIAPLLRCATQIADALAAAHAAGIVHRDLKPTNIMVTPQGLVKVLDFGLAKLSDGSSSADEHTRTAPQAASPTERGVILGTAAYMSPEQAEGGAVDERSDIFSFGSVLYEMSSGRRAFDGSTTMATIAAVLRDDPPQLSTITAALPHDLEILIHRCLKKDPARRVQHMIDLKVALQELKEDSESGRLMTSVATVTAAKRRPRWPLAAAVFVVTAVVAGWFMFGRTAGAPPPRTLTRLTFDTGMTSLPALSPDGKLVAYMSDRATANPNLFLQQVEGGQTVQLTNHEGDVGFPAFSRDGNRIAYVVRGKDEGVYVVATIGGEPKKVAPKGFAPRFSPDGSRLVYSITENFRGELMLVSSAGSQPSKVPGGFFATGSTAVWSADGSHLLAQGVLDLKAPRREAEDWYAIAVSDGTAVRTGAAAALRAQGVVKELDPFPSPDDWTGGSVLFSAGNPDASNVWRVAVNPATFQLEGPAEQLTFGTSQEMAPTMALDGTLAFAAANIIADYWTLPIDANAAAVTGPRTQIMNNSASDAHVLSTDGTTLLFCSRRGGNSDIWSRDLRTGKEATLVVAPTEEHVLAASADATSFLYLVRTVKPAVYLGTISGAPPRQVCERCGHVALSPDASRMLYIAEPDHRVYRLMDIASGTSVDFITSATHQFGGAAFSPDGQWAALSAQDGTLFMVPVRNSPVEEKEMIAVRRLKTGAQWLSFSPDGGTIYYGSTDDGHICLYAQRLSASRQASGEQVAIAHLHERNAYTHPHGMRVGADKIVLLMNQGTSNIWLMRPRQ